MNKCNLLIIATLSIGLLLLGCSSVSADDSNQVTADVINAYSQLDKSARSLDVNKAKVEVISDIKSRMVWFSNGISSAEMGGSLHEYKKIILTWQLLEGKWKVTSREVKSKSEFSESLFTQPNKPKIPKVNKAAIVHS